MKQHIPVLLPEALNFLDIKENGRYVDATLGFGGHSIEILKRGGKVLGIDYDSDSLRTALERIKSLGLESNFKGVVGNFRDINEIVSDASFGPVDGVLYDLGYSSIQLEDSETGLSFLRDGPLDMRLDKSLGVTAADLVNVLSAKQLEDMFRTYGEERLAKKFAQEIVQHRSLKKFELTSDLANLLSEVAPSGYDGGRTHPAMRVFQALRIVVNDEIENLKTSLPRAVQSLKLPGGRLVVISFHSLEDRVAKEFGRQNARPNEESLLVDVSNGLVVPTNDEVKKNSRSRSAKLRAYELQSV